MSVREQPLLPFLSLEYSADSGETWTALLAKVNKLSVQRGGNRTAISQTVDVGTLTCTLVNEGDPLTGGLIRPNQPVRLVQMLPQEDGSVSYGASIFRGLINDLYTAYNLDKSTGKLTTIVTVSAVDSVQSLQATTRYGAVTDGGAGFESWAARIIRLSASALVPVSTPSNSSEQLVYSLG